MEESTQQHIVYEDALITIHMQNKDSDQEVVQQYPGKIAVGTGLGYWIGEQEPGNAYRFYALTHLPSGYKFPVGFLHDEEVARRIIERIAPLMNWDRPLEQLYADPGFSEANQRFGEIVLEVLTAFYRLLPAAPTPHQSAVAWLN